MKIGVDIIDALRYKLIMFGVVKYVYTNVLFYNKSVYNNTITPESVTKKKHHYIAYNM